MLFLLSPAKTLDYETPVPATLRRKSTEPAFADRAADLIGVLRRKTPAQVAALMDLSPRLAALNVERYAAWRPQPAPHAWRPAVLAFDGDVYDGLRAPTLSAADLAWAQSHLVILSGLYGVLRPLDRLQPYRLEMGTALPTRQRTAGGTRRAGSNLYDYWGDALAEYLNERQAGEAAPVVVNLASVEYARAALRPTLRARVVDCVFEEVGADGTAKVVSFFAKKARGLMARHAVVERARSLRALQGFAAEGYAWDSAASGPQRLVFRRPRRAAPAGAEDRPPSPAT